MKKNKKKVEEHSVSVVEHQIFEAGTHETKSGEKVTYTDQDLDEMCETFNADEPPAYIPGHSSDWPGVTMIPKLGEIAGSLKRVGHKLFAVGAEFTDRLAGWVKEGFYDQRSCEIGKENGKLKLYAVAMLGAQPPAIKGMPPINASMLTSDFMFSKPKVSPLEFADSVNEPVEIGDQIDAVEKAGKDDTLKNVSQSCATFLEDFEESLNDDYNEDKMRNLIYQFTSDILSECSLHASFIEKLEQVEEANEGEMSRHKGFWREFAGKLKSLISTNQQKESDMDTKEKEGYELQIAALKKENAEFSTAKTTAETARVEAEKVVAEAADKTLRAEIHSFCETNKLNTNKYKEMKIEDVFFAAAKANQTIEFAGKDKDNKDVIEKRPLLTVLQELSKTFQIASPTEGEITDFNKSLPHEKTGTDARLEMAQKYVTEHPTEFSEHKEMIQKVAAALRMESNSQIKFK